MLGRDGLCSALGSALALVTAAAIMGCGGGTDTSATGGAGGATTTTTTTTTDSTTSDTTSSSSTTTTPMCMGEGPVLAVKRLYLGEGVNGQWKKFGFDIDEKVSTASSTDVCQPAAGAKTGVPYPDGDNGIDNSFGKNLLPLILSLYPNWPQDINAAIDLGLTTVLFKLECLPPTGDSPQFTTKLFGATPLGYPPNWDGADIWPVAPELLADPTDASSSTIIFNSSSVTSDVYDAGANATFVLTVPVSTINETRSIKLTLRSAKLQMTLSPDRSSATMGMIGGVLDTEELKAEVKKIGDLLGICSSPLFQGLLTEIDKASDIMNDGTQDPTKTCNGITMGMGFEMGPAQYGDVGPVTPVGTTCP
jgi:hypothetical protein